MKTTFIVLAMLFAVISSSSISEGLYKISCLANGNVLDIEQVQTNDGANLIIYPWHDGTNQHFTVEYIEGNWATLIAQHSGKALSISSTSSETSYTQQVVTGLEEQQFKFTYTSDGHYLITNRASGLVMECNGDVTSQTYGNRLALQGARDCGDDQKYDFTPLDS